MELHEQEWELVNDDGFVYKRLKRHPTISTSTSPPPPAPERNNRKKTILLKLKRKYQQEILNWEHLSNTLKALQTHPQPTVTPHLHVSLSTTTTTDSTYHHRHELAETLLLQVEGQEAFINDVSMLCDAAESISNAQEQLLKQPFIYLPIWESSPRKLITGLLCEQ